eukprot:339928_1
MTLSGAQRQKVQQFRAITTTSDAIAQQLLSSNEWNMEYAMDYFYNNQHKFPTVQVGDRSKLERIFNKYADRADPSVMSGEGMMAFFSEVGVDPEGVVGLAIAWKLNMKEMGFFRRSEFVNGFSELGVDKQSGLNEKVREIAESLSDPTTFKTFYRWLFDHIKGGSKKRTVAKGVAIHVFRMVFPQAHYPVIQSFCGYLENHDDEFVNRDVWEQLLDFMTSHKADLSDYDADTGAWPVLFDEFVEQQLKSIPVNCNDSDQDHNMIIS